MFFYILLHVRLEVPVSACLFRWQIQQFGLQVQVGRKHFSERIGSFLFDNGNGRSRSFSPSCTIRHTVHYGTVQQRVWFLIRWYVEKKQFQCCVVLWYFKVQVVFIRLFQVYPCWNLSRAENEMVRHINCMKWIKSLIKGFAYYIFLCLIAKIRLQIKFLRQHVTTEQCILVFRNVSLYFTRHRCFRVPILFKLFITKKWEILHQFLSLNFIVFISWKWIPWV